MQFAPVSHCISEDNRPKIDETTRKMVGASEHRTNNQEYVRYTAEST
jgi:hypothetical protein